MRVFFLLLLLPIRIRRSPGFSSIKVSGSPGAGSAQDQTNEKRSEFCNIFKFLFTHDSFCMHTVWWRFFFAFRYFFRRLIILHTNTRVGHHHGETWTILMTTVCLWGWRESVGDWARLGLGEWKLMVIIWMLFSLNFWNYWKKKTSFLFSEIIKISLYINVVTENILI